MCPLLNNEQSGHWPYRVLHYRTTDANDGAAGPTTLLFARMDPINKTEVKSSPSYVDGTVTVGFKVDLNPLTVGRSVSSTEERPLFSGTNNSSATFLGYNQNFKETWKMPCLTSVTNLMPMENILWRLGPVQSSPFVVCPAEKHHPWHHRSSRVQKRKTKYATITVNIADRYCIRDDIDNCLFIAANRALHQRVRSQQLREAFSQPI